MSSANGVLPPAVGTITFAGSQPLWASANPASGTTEFKGNVQVDGALTVDGAITSKTGVAAATTTASAVALTLSNSENTYNIQCDGNGNLFVGVQEPASKGVMLYDAVADTLTFNEPISSKTPAVAKTEGQTSTLPVALQLDMSGVPAGQYMCYAGTLENGTYNVSCPIAWDGTSVIGGARALYDAGPPLQIAGISTRTAGDTKIQYSAANSGDAGTYSFFVSVIPLTVGNPF